MENKRTKYWIKLINGEKISIQEESYNKLKYWYVNDVLEAKTWNNNIIQIPLRNIVLFYEREF